MPSKTLTVNLATAAVSPEALAISVRNYATGDGVTDDTLGVQAALDALANSTTANCLDFGDGTYRLATDKAYSVGDGTGAQGSRVILNFDAADMEGRRIVFRGNGARLINDVPTTRCHLLFCPAVWASFRATGINFERSDSQLTAVAGSAPSGTAGLFFEQFDTRAIEQICVDNCQFINLHPSGLFYSPIGRDCRGLLKSLVWYNNHESCPYGSNTITPNLSYGGGAMLITLGAWVGDAHIANNTVEGAPKTFTVPDISKDGHWFGTALHLLYTGNIVSRIQVEACFMLASNRLLAYSFSTWTQPAVGDDIADGGLVINDSSSLSYGRTTSWTAGENVILLNDTVEVGRYTVKSYDAGARRLSLKVTVATATGVQALALYKIATLETDDTAGIVTGNIFDLTKPANVSKSVPAGPAIATTDVPLKVCNNLMIAVETGVKIYSKSTMAPLDDAKGSVISDNLIQLLANPSVTVSVANGANPLFTATTAHGYLAGKIIRITDMVGAGATDANGIWTVSATSLTATTFKVDESLTTSGTGTGGLASQPANNIGIYTEAADTIISSNQIDSPLPELTIGIYLRGRNAQVLNNTVAFTATPTLAVSASRAAYGILVSALNGAEGAGAFVSGNKTKNCVVAAGTDYGAQCAYILDRHQDSGSIQSLQAANAEMTYLPLITPAFVAHYNGVDYTVTDSNVSYYKMIPGTTEINIGTMLATSTGLITIPSTGMWRFGGLASPKSDIHAIAGSGADNATPAYGGLRLSLINNTSLTEIVSLDYIDALDPTNLNPMLKGEVELYLVAGTVVHFRITAYFGGATNKLWNGSSARTRIWGRFMP